MRFLLAAEWAKGRVVSQTQTFTSRPGCEILSHTRKNNYQGEIHITGKYERKGQRDGEVPTLGGKKVQRVGDKRSARQTYIIWKVLDGREVREISRQTESRVQ